MINFSRVDTKEKLVEAINALPESTPQADAESVKLAKAVVLNHLAQLTTNGAHVNFRVNSINQWRQTEVQVAGQVIAPPAAKAA